MASENIMQKPLAGALTGEESLYAVKDGLDVRVTIAMILERVSKLSLGLDNVDNTSDAGKPVSIAVAQELDLIRAQVEQLQAVIEQSGSDEYVVQTLQQQILMLEQNSYGLHRRESYLIQASQVLTATHWLKHIRTNAPEGAEEITLYLPAPNDYSVPPGTVFEGINWSVTPLRFSPQEGHDNVIIYKPVEFDMAAVSHGGQWKLIRVNLEEWDLVGDLVRLPPV